MNKYDVLIIGSGPAAYTAAIYTSRAFLKTLLLSGTQPGGQLTTTTAVDNFPGFPEGVMGPDLMERMRQQAERFGAEIVTDVASSVSRQGSRDRGPFASAQGRQASSKTFLIEGNQEYEGKAVIIATGAQAKTLGLPSEEQFRGKGISYCATCDGFFFKGKNIAVLGGGDTAMEEATFLTKFAETVTIIHRRNEFRASPIMEEKARKNPKIKFLLGKEIVEFFGDTVLKGIRIQDKTNGTNMTNKTESIHFDGVFVAIGHTPATEFLKGTVDPDSIGVELDEKGYIKTRGSRFPSEILRVNEDRGSKIGENKQRERTEYQTGTSVDGIFAAGDCVDSLYRQAIVAAGMGCMAAFDAMKWLEQKEQASG